MSNEEIKENNAIIAEFMGLNVYADLDDYMFVSQRLSEKAAYISHLSYHHSWDALMPVVERIQKEGFRTSIENNWTSIDGCVDETDGMWFETTGGNLDMMQATYEAVVNFIKWYNENKQ